LENPSLYGKLILKQELSTPLKTVSFLTSYALTSFWRRSYWKQRGINNKDEI
jgi:hypothetical protein